METIVWLILFILFLLIEIATLGLTTIWFAGGALVAFIAALLGLTLPVQLVCFFTISIIMLIFTRPVAVKYLNRQRVATNSESLIGAEAKVVERIDNINSQGVVTINGLEWTARSANNEILEIGAIVRVVKISGVKAIVESFEEKPISSANAVE